MDSQKKKDLINSYKNRTVTGGVYCIQCSGSDRKWIKSTLNMQASENRFLQSVHLNNCPEPSMLREWNEYGTASFSFIRLEELEKGEAQTDEEFAADIKTLYEMWLERGKV